MRVEGKSAFWSIMLSYTFWQRISLTGETIILRKPDLASLPHHTVYESLQRFFEPLEPDSRDRIFGHYLEVLYQLSETVHLSNVQLISSSILFVYDLSDPRKAVCKIIDFAHSHLHEHQHLDTNYLEGLKSFIGYMELLQKEPTVIKQM